MSDFVEGLRLALTGMLAAHGLDGDVDEAVDFGDEVLADAPLDATQFQWFLLSEAVAHLYVHDELFRPPPELTLLLRYLANATERVDHQELLIDLPLKRFPEGFAQLCEEGLIVALEGWSGPPAEVEALLVSVSDPKPGESGRLTYHCVSEPAIQTFDEPIAYLQALTATA